MKYESTRGSVKGISFKDAVIMGLPSDGGLLLPETIPFVGGKLADWESLSYQSLAFEIMSLYIDDIDSEALKEIITRSYATFDHKAVTPLRRLEDIHLLELFHGPTLAFTDVALQFLVMFLSTFLRSAAQPSTYWAPPVVIPAAQLLRAFVVKTISISTLCSPKGNLVPLKNYR